MRILIVTNTYPPGDITGVGALVVELAQALVHQGHQVVVLTRRRAPDDALAVATGGGKLTFPVRAALAYLRMEPFDLVHVHESDGCVLVGLARLLRRLARRGQPRLVATLQVSYVRERAAVRAVLADGRVVSEPTSGERVFANLRAPIHAALGRWTARLVDGVVAPSQVTAAELREDYGAQVLAVVANGVAAPAAAQPYPDLSHPVILYSGRLRTRKAVAVLLVAFAEVARSVPGATLILVGDGEQRPQLERQAAALGIADRVRFTGQVPRDATARYYASADVFCLPSTYEGQPLAILEAMAHGLPVVATRVAGIPETVIDGVTGYVVDAEDATALGAALLGLCTDPALRQRLARASAERFQELYRVDRIAAAYVAVFERILTGRILSGEAA